MIRTHTLPAPIALAIMMLSLAIGPAVPQDIGLAPVESKEVARGYRASTLELKEVVNDRGENIGRINDFVFGQERGIFVILSIGSFGFNGSLVAVPFRKFQFNNSNGNIVLPGASRAALEKLPVFFYDH